ncbi:SDR family NAD(P)-dependent oxidoreductase [Rhizobiales bacterium]|uniref:type I polyketide synthase n=1 Tax=Hongsoonwoonella zoysiae TaxID=2821844 RepID=UPI00155F91F4|nr:type I polyketide synthase [Hongsoonwoonella zoysiae]NRG18484.1 SDR family NAD(P)-dependent oxidoreductase [Hongsoonwoonella zoysiae]
MAIRGCNVSISGYAARLPGAASADEFWRVLEGGKCTVSSIGDDRFPTSRFIHPDRSAAGKTYTFAAGVIDDVWGFDPGFFGISPREAIQLDPQQRLLLQVVWEALEHAGIKPSELSESGAGVYVGASSLDYHHRFVFDPAAADVQLMTGNTLSIISNRISYIYNLRGPSFTVDTACSSSLVALHEAINALDSGQIETAIVAGVNMLLSPLSFVGFSRASMLSEKGLCRAFDADGDGYVRSEGAVALILRRMDVARDRGDEVHARIVASGLNSDGRTVGLSLPSSIAQADLLRDIYGSLELDVNDLAFIEAHGTGTRVGDPAEANAIGSTLARRRDSALPIGSVKTNIGHLESASGTAGLLKSLLSLRNDIFPRSLHFETPNPDIDFDGLNLSVAGNPVTLERKDRPRLAGINSFGFGGTNAHVVIADGEPTPKDKGPSQEYAPLVISAKSRDALRKLCAEYRQRLVSSNDPLSVGALVAAAAHNRDALDERLVVHGATAADKAAALDAYLEGGKSPALVTGQANQHPLKVVFAFSGNGSQWAGMGRDAFFADAPFRSMFREIDDIFKGLAGWSLETMLFSQDLEDEIDRAAVAQPLLFALQVSLVRSLREKGIKPDAVIGHSVGEVAGAWASGALGLADAVRVVHARSLHQEVTRDLGGMAALLLPEDAARAAIDNTAYPGLEIAAVNSARSVTISGPSESLDGFARHARKNRWAMRRLKIAYPFHCALVDAIEEPLLGALGDIRPAKPEIRFISTVDPEDEAPVLDAGYWWRNVRRPVQFAKAVARVLDDEAAVLVEIGPKPILATYINDNIREAGKNGRVVSSLDTCEDFEPDVNPVERVAAGVFVNGGRVDMDVFVGPRGRMPGSLPTYPWQNEEFKPASTDEQNQAMFGQSWPLLGYRFNTSSTEWFDHCDPQRYPFLLDHKIEEAVVFPAAGFVAMALRAVEQWTEKPGIELRDFEIFRPLVFDAGGIRETMVRLSADDRVIEIFSRPRLQHTEWSLHARGRFVTLTSDGETGLASIDDRQAEITLDENALYELTASYGLNYGPAFRRAERVDRLDERTARVHLLARSPAVEDYVFPLCPTLLDAGFHGLFALLAGHDGDAAVKKSYLPVRIDRLRVFVQQENPTQVNISVTRASSRSVEASFDFLNADGILIARLAKARFKAVQLGVDAREEKLSYRTISRLLPDENALSPASELLQAKDTALHEAGIVAGDDRELDDAPLLLEALSRSVAHNSLYKIVGDATFDVEDLVATRQIAENARSLVHALLHRLRAAGIATDTEAGWRIDNPSTHLPVDALLQTLVQAAGDQVAPAAMLSRLDEALPGMLRTGLPEKAEDWYAPSLFEAYRSFSPSVQALFEGAVAFARNIIERWPADHTLTILIAGARDNTMAQAIAPLLDPALCKLVIADVDEAMVQRLKADWRGNGDVRFLALDDEATEACAPFDLVLSAGGLDSLGAPSHERLARLLAQDGVVFAIEPIPTITDDLLRGIGRNWWAQGVSADFPASGFQWPEEWRTTLLGAGFSTVDTFEFSSRLIDATVIVARAGDRRRQSATEPDEATLDEPSRLLVISSPEGKSRRIADSLKSVLHAHGIQVSIAIPGETTGESAEGLWTIAPENDPERSQELLGVANAGIVYLAGTDGPGYEGDHNQAVDSNVWFLTTLFRAIGSSPTPVRIVAPGAQRDLIAARPADPVQTAIWSFARVAMNEYPGIELSVIDIDPDAEPLESARGISRVFRCETDEREIVVAEDRLYGLRILRDEGKAATREIGPLQEDTAMRLDIRRQGSLDELAWRAQRRLAPSDDEIEIAVEASGLNFRDVMWALGLLPEEALEDGFAGPTLGMECCGRVVRTGSGASRFNVGDRVITFAPACFASHVTVTEAACAPMPGALSAEEAATIPVTFLTAYYALCHLAHLSEGETVLIHGGAGGVGLAALQIAQWRGARVISTAGSEEKRSFLRLLGADHVLDSRSLEFADRVMQLTDGEGVDVVLNSLSGEAMEHSIEVLRPFGRFLELGKRDFFENTHIGLRPFRQNLSYFGIDADQLLTRQRPLAEKLFGDLVALFEEGVLSPLPFRAFAADKALDAFRLMQQAGHIGKIVLTPPQVPVTEPAATVCELRDDATYVVVGGFGGFGTELLKRMVLAGARHLLVLSRTGAASEAARAAVAELEAAGAQVHARECDVTDESSLASHFGDARKSLPPIRGVFHTAMVIEDTLLANLEHEALSRVLAPKVRGAELLDRLTAEDPLDHFVLFSSATTLVGNPGQANYVAANGYLEGLARRRRAEGRPALAVSWGAISDAGYLARNTGVSDLLARKLGRHALSAREALDGLFDLMGQPQDDVGTAATGYARIDWQAAQRDLKLLSTPLADLLSLGDADDASAGDGEIDLASMVENLSEKEASKLVADLLAKEVGKILRVSAEEIDARKPLSDIGMDSLMALELRMAAERQLGVDIPLMSLANGTTLADISAKVLAGVKGSEDSSSGLSREAKNLAGQHTDDVELGDISEIVESIEAESDKLRSLL